MLVLSAAEMQACDRATTEQFGIPSIELMRAAAASVAAFTREQFPRVRRLTVLCGKGNNGGDGMMTARLLANTGLDVTTLLFGAPDDLKGDAAQAWHELTDPIHGTVHVIGAAEKLELHKEAFAADLIIDALLGTGFKPPLKGLALDALEWVKASRTPILAIDLPSGWPADEIEAAVSGAVFPADAVITFTAPKPAHVFGQLTRVWDQPVLVAPIGSPDAAIVSAMNLDWAGSAIKVAQTPRPPDSNKGKFGHVLVVGGSVGKSGAPAMTSLAALRAGAGLVTAAIPAPVLSLVTSAALELMTWPMDPTPDGHIAAQNGMPERLAAITAGKTVLALGPGLGQTSEVAEFLAGLLAATALPTVVDADALNVLAAHPELLAGLSSQARGGRTVVLTPHPGEMARLASKTIAEVQANRLETARSFAQQMGVILVLKGARTLIAHPDGRIAVNTTGNPGMAKGGSGDLLTGLIAGLLAQFPRDAGRAVAAAVYLHGLAADFAVRAGDEHTLLATDSLAFLSQAFRFYSRGANGYVWIQGLPQEIVRAAEPPEAEL